MNDSLRTTCRTESASDILQTHVSLGHFRETFENRLVLRGETNMVELLETQASLT